jgi:hypothetical protein
MPRADEVVVRRVWRFFESSRACTVDIFVAGFLRVSI